MFRELSSEDYDTLLQLDAAAVKKQGASAELLSLLPETRQRAGVDSEPCCICMCSIDAGEAVKRLPCAHVFHAPCIDKWLLEKAVCPVDLRPVDGIMM
jgi:hypothetical protein